MLRKIPVLLLVIFLLGCSGTIPKQTHSFLALNTACSVTVLNSPRLDLKKVEDLVSNIELKMSSHIDSSDISNINKLAGVSFYHPLPQTLDVIKEGIRFGKLSNGSFDISIGPLVKLWGVGTKNRVPLEANIVKAKALVSYGDILIDDSNKVMLKRSGMELDLGGIAKGYASSKVKEYLVELGVESAIINLGGNIDLIGSKPKGVGWRVGIQHPREDRGKYIGILELNDKSLVSSGDYERFFIEDGIRYHHILDVKSGFPRNGEIISASIIGSSSIEGDGLSTITFGTSISYVKELQTKLGFQGVFITNKKEIYITEELKGIFTLTDESYKIIP